METLEVKHTPGPWLREGNTIYSLVHAGWRKGVEQFKNRFSATIQGDFETTISELEATAQLMAAAPDLLEVLEEVEFYLKPKVSRGYPEEETLTLYKSVVKAIAKAEGRA